MVTSGGVLPAVTDNAVMSEAPRQATLMLVPLGWVLAGGSSTGCGKVLAAPVSNQRETARLTRTTKSAWP